MKFRLPFQIYRTGVISRSNSPRKIINKFSKDNEAKVRKKTSKINSSYRAIISNYIYRFTHLPLKRTMSKLRNRAILRSAAKAHTSKMRNEFVFLQEPSRVNSTRRKPRNDEVTKEASECYMNSTKCANFMCAKSTARILLKQKDILCNKTSNKSVAGDLDDAKTPTQESQKPKDEPPKTPVAQVTRDTKVTNTATVAVAAAAAPPVQKVEKTVDIPPKEKWKIRPENHNRDTELKRLKRIIQSSDRNRNYKVEEAPPAPIRMDNVVGVPHFPKKLPKLPVQTMPKIEQVRPKEGPTLVAPKRKYDSPEMTRNYKITEDVSHGPPRMDNLVARNAKRFQSTTTARTIPTTEGNNKKIKPSNIQLFKNKNTVKEQKDVLHFSNDLMPKTKTPTRSLQQLNTANINVSERIKKYEELIKNNNNDKHRSKSEGCKSRLTEKKLTQGQQLEKKEHSGILTPKLSPFAIAEIRRKYYPPDTFEKQPLRITPQMTFEVPVIEKNDQPDTKLKHFYSQPKEQHKKLDVSLLEINPTGNIKKKPIKTRKIIVCNTGVEKGRDSFTLDLDSSNSLLDFTTTTSTVEPTNINLIAPKVMIPPPSKTSIATKNKRNFSSSAIDDCQEAYNICTDLINISNINVIYSDLTATPTKRKISANSKKSGEILPEAKAKKHNRIDATIPMDIDTVKQDRKFSTDVLTRNLEERNSREIDRNIMMSTNSNLHRTSQRNLSKRHCAIKVTSKLDNQVNIAPPTGASDKVSRQLSYRYYEQCTMASINIPPIPITAINEQNTIYDEISDNELVGDEGYNKMLNEKTTLINDYIKWKMQLQKFGSLPKKSNEPAKYCQNLSNKINKQNKFRMRKYKIIQRKQRTPSNNNLQVNQDQNDAITTTVNLIKNQVAQKCALFDKISDALLKKSNTIKFCDQAAAQQQREERRVYLQDNKKRKLSVVPMLDIPPKRRYTPNNNMETSNIVPPLEINTKPKTSPCREVKIGSPSRETKSAVSNKDIPKQVSPRKETIQQASPRPQQFSPRKEVPKQVSPRKENIQQVSPRPQQFSPRKETPQQLSPRKEQSQQFSPRKEQPQQLSPRKEQPQQLSPRREQPQQLSPRKEQPQQLSPRREQPQQFSPRKEQPQQLSPRKEQSQQFSPRKEQPQQLSPRKEIPQQLSPRKETKPMTPKREVPQEVSPRKEVKPTTPRKEIPKPISPRKDIKSPRMETKSCIRVLEAEPMEIDVPFNSTANSIDDRRRSYSRSSFKLKGPKAPSRESSRLESKSNLLPHSIKIKPHTIPATMKAKKFLAKIEAGPDTAGNLIKRIDRKTIKGPKSKTPVHAGGDNLSKYIS